MALIFWRKSEPPDDSEPHDLAQEVNEQHALPVSAFWTPDGSDEAVPVDEASPLPVRAIAESIFNSKIPISADIVWRLAREARIFVAGDGDQRRYAFRILCWEFYGDGRLAPIQVAALDACQAAECNRAGKQGKCGLVLTSRISQELLHAQNACIVHCQFIWIYCF